MKKRHDDLDLNLGELPRLPSSWSWERIEYAATNERNAIVDGPFGSNLKVSDYIEPPGVPVLTTANLRGDYSPDSVRYISKKKFEELRRSEVRGGDILVAKIGSCGLTGVYPSGMPSAIIPANLLKMTVGPSFELKFVLYYLNSPIFSGFLTKIISATAQPAFNVTKFRQLPFPVAPHGEQLTVVAEIEKQFTRLDAGIAALKRVQANLKRYRAAVLKAACEGRLVPTERDAWRKLRVSEIGRAITGNTPPTSDKGNFGDSLPFFKPTDLDVGYYVHEARQYLSKKGAKLSRQLPAGSVLVTCIGATIGKTGLARVPCATNQQINALVPNLELVMPEWIYHVFTSPLGQRQIIDNASATTLPILNKSRFEELEIPVPPLAEQKRIVEEVERRLSVLSELETAVQANLLRASRLRQAVLARAFRGNSS